MRSIVIQQPNQFAKQNKHGDKERLPLVMSGGRSVSPLSTEMPLLQRQCACGGGCPRCQDNLMLQTKLKISELGDQYEQEADLMGDEVMRMPEPVVQRQMEIGEDEEEERMVQRQAISRFIPPLIQRQDVPEIEDEEGDIKQRKESDPQDPIQDFSIVQEVLNSPGQPLDSETRTFMESRLGSDFTQVRIHADAKAAKSAQAINALAYTVGQTIVFGTGQYSPKTNTGKQLLGHELFHTLQQQGHTESNGSQLTLQQPSTVYEQQADQAAKAVIYSSSLPSVTKLTNSLTVQRQVAGETETEISTRDRQRDEARHHTSISFRQLQRTHPTVARQVEMLSSSYRQLISSVDNHLSLTGIYDLPGVDNEVQRAARQRVFRYEDQLARGNLYDSRHLSQWLEYITHALSALHPLLQSLIGRFGSSPLGGNYSFIGEVAESQRRHLVTSARNLARTSFIQQGDEERQEAREARTREQTESIVDSEERQIHAIISRLQNYVQRNRESLQMYAGIHVSPILEILEPLERNPARWRRLFETLRSTEPTLLNTILLEGRLVRAIQGEGDVLGSLGRVLIHALMGEFHEGTTLEETEEANQLAEFGATTRQEEAEAEDLASITIDTAIGLIPGFDQLSDARDLIAHVHFLSSREGEVRSPLRWVSLVFSLIGAIPEVGTAIKGLSKVLMDGVSRHGYQVVARILNLIERALPGVFDELANTRRFYQEGWQRFTTRASEIWSSLLTRGESILRTLLDITTEIFHQLREYSTRMLPEAFIRARVIFDEAFEAVAESLRRTGTAVAESIPQLLDSIRTRILSLSATGRLQLEVERLNSLERAAREGLERGDTALAGQLIPELDELVVGAERQVDELTTELSERTTTATEIPNSSTLRSERESLRITVQEPDNIRLVSDPNLIDNGYYVEVAVGEHTYRRRTNGIWCRFSDEFCGVEVDAEIDEAVERAFVESPQHRGGVRSPETSSPLRELRTPSRMSRGRYSADVACDPELSLRARNYRISEGLVHPEDFGRNVCIVRVRVNGQLQYIPAVNVPGTPLHAEVVAAGMIEQLRRPGVEVIVEQLYSERIPCIRCGELLDRVYSEAAVFYHVNERFSDALEGTPRFLTLMRAYGLIP